VSLKAFHVFFVVVSTLLALGFGVWSVNEYSRAGQSGTLAMGVASFIAAVALVVYGFWFLRKLKNVSYL
jgi:flagellar biogenesis protein FliO